MNPAPTGGTEQPQRVCRTSWGERRLHAVLIRAQAPSSRRGLLGWLARSAIGIALGLSATPATGGTASATTSSRLRRWAMVIDLRYCDGCQATGKPPQCTTACIEGHFA